MSNLVTAGDIVANFLNECGVKQAFGVISIHNMPILDAISRQNKIRFVPARSEGGAVNMADANARVSGGLGVAISSTGTAAGNACGAIVEAMTAGTPLLHLTGQIDLKHLDRQKGFIHEAADQLGMLNSAGKAAFRVWSPETLLGTLREAVQLAHTPPRGPVSIEIPIDIQGTQIPSVSNEAPLLTTVQRVNEKGVAALAEDLACKKRVMLWLGGGARDAGKAAAALADLGIGLVTSVNGRGIYPEDGPNCLGAFNFQSSVEKLYATCDAMVVVGSRLRSNETLSYTLELPSPLFQIDGNPRAEGRSYPVQRFICGDASSTLDRLAAHLENNFEPDPAFSNDIFEARSTAERGMRDALGPYNEVLDTIIDTVPKNFLWVRDITLSNTIWGNRLPCLDGPRNGIHALGGGIGQGLPMSIGAALAVQSQGQKTLALVGDGGFAVTLGELGTAKQENTDIVILLMNDGGYGVIKNIQDAKFSGRQVYADVIGPDWAELCRSFAVPFHLVRNTKDLKSALINALGVDGPALIEVDMKHVGDFSHAFAGPPSRSNQNGNNGAG